MNTSRRYLRKYLLVLPALLASGIALAWQGKCVGVSDGDTISVMRAGRAERIRLNGIDCPESGQAFGSQAKQATSGRVFGTVVSVVPVTIDRYGRTVAKVWCTNGTSLNETLVQSGYAWWYKRYAPSYQRLAELEREAREAKRGLWSDPHPQPPWEFRHTRSVKPSTSMAVPKQAVRKPAGLRTSFKGTVYSTRTGTCFHRTACDSLRRSKIRMTRQAAVAAGLRPCARCCP